MSRRTAAERCDDCARTTVLSSPLIPLAVFPVHCAGCCELRGAGLRWCERVSTHRAPQRDRRGRRSTDYPWSTEGVGVEWSGVRWTGTGWTPVRLAEGRVQQHSAGRTDGQPSETTDDKQPQWRGHCSRCAGGGGGSSASRARVSQCVCRYLSSVSTAPVLCLLFAVCTVFAFVVAVALVTEAA